MLLAELEIHHSRAIAPTRRVSLGRCHLPADPAPGPGGALVAGVVARFAPELDPDLVARVPALADQIAHGRRIPQPQLRHRFQHDRVGLLRTRHLLLAEHGTARFVFDASRATPAQQVLGAVYAIGEVAAPARRSVLDAVRFGLEWAGPVDAAFADRVGAGRLGTLFVTDDPVGWALDVLGLDGSDRSQTTVRRRFRELLREAHPDQGGRDLEAADRIRDLAEARRILLG